MTSSSPQAPPDKSSVEDTTIDDVGLSIHRASFWVAVVGYLATIIAGLVLWLAVKPWLGGPALTVRWQEKAPAADTQEVARVRLPAAEALLPTGSSPESPGKGGYDDPGFDRFRDAQSSQGPSLLKVIPPSQRWQVFFPEGLSDGPYARQLDTLGIELGVIRGDGTIDYLSGVSKKNSQKRSGKLADEKRLYLTWSRGDLLDADRTLLHNAGLNPGLDHIVLHFCPDGTEVQLAQLEKEFQGRDAKDIFLTRFALKETFRGFRLYVMEQILRE